MSALKRARTVSGASLLLAAMLGLAGPAHAQPLQGLYVAAGGGANFAGAPTSAGALTRVHTETGPLGLGAIGWGFDDGLRAEIEGSFRSNAIGSIDTLRIDGRSLPLGRAGGHLRTSAGMVNLAYDIPLRGLVRPYIIAGIGYGGVDFSGAGGDSDARIRVPRRNIYDGPVVVGFGSAGAFAYQAGFGLAAAVPGLRGLQATIEYRYFGTAGASVPVTRTASNMTDTINGAVPSGRAHDRFTLGDHALLVGLRYRFGML